jgi:fatty-acyl-CoA synthase
MTVSAAVAEKMALVPTPNDDAQPRRYADFATFCDALDYAAQGERGFNFHDPRGTLKQVYPFAQLRSDALVAARRLVARGVKPGDRLALIAETGPEFAALFCGAVYAGAWPVPLPLPTSFGGKDNYIDQLAVQLASSDPVMLVYPDELAEMCGQAAARQGCPGLSWAEFDAGALSDADLPQADPDAICYLQYSSGSTRFPHGVAVTHRALLANLAGHSHGMEIGDGDRCVSWLPWYHDMGLVGCFLSPIANQVSVDYLKTEDFARRPLAWLDLISRNQGTTLSYSPTFGYDICARRISSQTNVADRFDLSRWRVAGNGADMIRPDVMQGFVNAFADAGFKASAFLPSYGLAEATLAVTIMPPGEGIRVELVEEERLSGSPRDLSRPARYRAIVNCGLPVLGMEVAIRGENGEAVEHHHIGKVVPWFLGHALLLPRSGIDRCLHGRWLARHRRHGLRQRAGLSVHRWPRQGHDHHQRQEPLAAGYRMGRGTAPRLPPGGHRGLLGGNREWRGDARRAGPLPRVRPGRAGEAARPDPRQGPLDHRHELRGRTRAAAHPAPHQLGQAVARQGQEAVSFGRDRAVQPGGLIFRNARASSL